MKTGLDHKSAETTERRARNDSPQAAENELLRQAKEVLHEGEDKYRALIDMTDTGYVILDREGRVVDANQEYVRLTGRTGLREILGKSVEEWTAEHAKPSNLLAVCQCVKERRIRNFSTDYVDTNGRITPIEINATVEGEGESLRILTLCRDINKRKLAEEALRRSETKCHCLLESMKDAFVIVDMSGRLQQFNDTFRNMLGYSKEELLSLHYLDLTPTKWHDMEARIVDRQILERGFSDVYEKEYCRKDGTVFPVELRTFLVRDEAGHPEAIWAIIRDVSERKRENLARSRSLERQERINQLHQVLLVSGELMQKLEVITRGIVDIFDADFCRIWLIGPGDLCSLGCTHAVETDGPHTCINRNKCLRLIVSSGRYTHTDGTNHRRVPFGAYKIGRVAAGSEHKFLTNDVVHDPMVHNHDWAKDLGLVSFAGYQLRPTGGETLGVLALFSKHPITPEEDAQLDSLSDTAAQVVCAAQAEKALRESEEMFRSICTTAKDAIVLMDNEGRCSYWNPAAEQIFGYSTEEILGKSLHDTIAPERFLEAHAAGFASWREKGTGNAVGKTLELAALKKDGKEIPVELSLASIKRSGRWNAIAILRDLTKRRELESQLAQAQKLESIGQLAAGIAHEINTPIQYVGDNLSFLQGAFEDILAVLGAYRKLTDAAGRGDSQPGLIAEVKEAASKADLPYLEEEIPKALGQSLEGAKRVATIVRAMKEFSHPGGGEKMSVDLNHAIETTITVAKNEWKYVAEVVTALDPSLPSVRCLPGEMNQGVLNLLINAAHAIGDAVGGAWSGKKGTITVTTRQVDGEAEIRVADTGTGIPEAIRSKIFDPFFTTKPEGKGTGQGLAIAYDVVVRKHGGKICFETEAGKGTTFIIRIPIEPTEARVEEHRSSLVAEGQT